MDIRQLYIQCRKADTSFVVAVLRFIGYRLRGKKIFAHQRAIIKHPDNITTNDVLSVGVSYFGFMHKKDVTLLNVQGRLTTHSGTAIGRGCRIDIGKGAQVEIGRNTSINPLTKIIIQHGLTIGEDCLVSWDCQLLDDDFHQLDFPGRQEVTDPGIEIGDHVWIGSQVSIQKGTRIPRGCMVAANAVVRGVFTEENALLAGNPAQVVKRDINWK